MTSQARHPAGVHNGGQFAVGQRTEGAVTLTASRDLPPTGGSLVIRTASRMFEVKLLGALGRLADADAKTDLDVAYDQGWAHADADIAVHLRVPDAPTDGSSRDIATQVLEEVATSPLLAQSRVRRLDAHRVDRLAEYALNQAITAQIDWVAAKGTSRWHLMGRRNAYAYSHAELTLRDVDHPEAATAGDRLIEALAAGITDRGAVHGSTWPNLEITP